MVDITKITDGMKISVQESKNNRAIVQKFIAENYSDIKEFIDAKTDDFINEQGDVDTEEAITRMHLVIDIQNELFKKLSK